MNQELIDVVENNHPKICAYCHSEILATQEGVACRRCSTPYHKDCWREIKRCAALNCTSQQYIRLAPAPTRPPQGDLDVTPISTPSISITEPDDILGQINIISDPEFHLTPTPPQPLALPTSPGPQHEITIHEWELKLAGLVKQTRLEQGLEKIGLQKPLQRYIKGQYYPLAQGIILGGMTLTLIIIIIMIFSLMS